MMPSSSSRSPGYGGAADIPRNLRSSPIVPEMIRDRIAGLTYTEIIALSP